MAKLFVDDFFEEEEFLMLYDAVNQKNPSIPYSQYGRFDIDSITDDECKTEFRVGKSELNLLAEALGIPDSFVCSNGTKATGLEGLCVVLKRFAYPCRYVDMVPRFGRSVPELCEITSEVSDFIYDNHGYLLQSLDQPWLSPDNLQIYADAIHTKGGALQNCWGFIDGTVRPISRPGEHQRVMYNGHKRIHALKFQSVVAPNGLIANLYGPVGKQ